MLTRFLEITENSKLMRIERIKSKSGRVFSSLVDRFPDTVQRMAKLNITKGIYRMPGSRWLWYRWSENGRRYAVSLETEDEATAIVKKKAILADVARRGSEAYRKQAVGGSGPQNEMSRVIWEYLENAKNRDRKAMLPVTAKNIRYVLDLFAEESKIEGLGDLIPNSMSTWLKAQKKKGRSIESIRSHTKNLKAFRRYLLDQGLVREDSLPDLTMPDAPPIGRKNYLEQTEVDRVIESVMPEHSATAKPETIKKAKQAADDLTFIFHCGFNAGLRRKEISEAKVEWFDLRKGLLHVFSDADFTTKDKDGRTIPLKKPFLEFLKTYLSGKTGYVLAPDKRKGKGTYRFDPNRRVRSHFRTLRVRCTWHDMRRSFASNLVSKGESIYIVAKWLGDGVAVVERSYGHVAPAAGNIDR
jgi:integrase